MAIVINNWVPGRDFSFNREVPEVPEVRDVPEVREVPEDC